jgi:hypothetical protein
MLPIPIASSLGGNADVPWGWKMNLYARSTALQVQLQNSTNSNRQRQIEMV